MRGAAGSAESAGIMSSDVPFVGRQAERDTLQREVRRAKEGVGSAWVISGAGGMGKTRLARWTQETAEREGLTVRWGYSLKEAQTAFFPFQQIYRGLGKPAGASRERGPSPGLVPLSGVALVEEPRPQGMLRRVSELSHDHPTLLLGRDRPSVVRSRFPLLDPTAQLLWLTKGEGDDHVNPGDLDGIGDRIRTFLESTPGGIVALSAVDYLVSQNGFSPVLRLLQFLRDVTEETGGHLFLTLNPESFEKREVSLIEGEAEVIRPDTELSEAPDVPDTPITTMIHYLDVLESQEVPLLVVVDDIQWADPDSWRAFQFLARNITRLRVILLATHRDDDPPSATDPSAVSWNEMLDDMSREGTIHRIELKGLDENESEELARKALRLPFPRSPSEARIHEFLARAGGNPFYVKETMRQLVEEGYIREEHGVAVLSLPPAADKSSRSLLPESIRRLVMRRLDRLTEGERTVLKWATVAGSEFDLAPLEGCVPRELHPVLGILERLEHQEHLLERREGVGPALGWSFMHPLVWEVMLIGFTESERGSMARELGTWWVENRPNEVDTIARLFHDALYPRGGLPWVRQAIELAILHHSVETVERYHGWLQELLVRAGATPADRIQEGLAVVSRMGDEIGPTAQAAHIVATLEKLGPEGDLRIEVEAMLVTALWGTSTDEAKKWLRQMERRLEGRESIPPRLRYRILRAQIPLAILEYRIQDVEKLSSTLVDLGPEAPLSGRVTGMYYSIYARCHLGKVEAARERYAQLKALEKSLTSSRMASALPGAQVFLTEAVGDYAGQCAALEASLLYNRQIASPFNVAVSLHNLVIACVMVGDLPRAKAVQADCRKHCERFRVERSAFSHPAAEGHIALRERRWQEAQAFFREAIDATIKAGLGENLEDFQLDLLNAYVGGGQLPEAEALWDGVKGSIDREPSYAVTAFLAEGSLRSRQGRLDEARKILEDALAQADALTPSVRYLQGFARGHLARWESAYGDPKRSEQLWKEAQVHFDSCGVLPDAWVRSWPPPECFAPSKGTDTPTTSS